MSLTAWLVVLGALVLAGVLAHGVWSARRAGPRQPGRGAADVAQFERHEPSLGDAAAAAQPAHGGDGASGPAAPEPMLEVSLEPRAPRRVGARIDALIDAIAPLVLEAPISAEFALMHQPPTRRAGSKPFLIEGLDTETGAWEPLTPGRKYGELQAGVQLANRGGALNEIEYSEFVQKIEAFAQLIGALPDFPDMLDVAARARELDQFAGAHDAQLAVRLRARSVSWSVAYVAQNAARHGLVAGAVPGRLVLPGGDEGDPPVLTLGFDAQAALADDASQAVVRELVLSLDVPQTDASTEPFAAWQEVARALAQDIDADLLDDQGRALNLHAFAAIGSELGKLYAQLAAHDLAAGSPAARRLFS